MVFARLAGRNTSPNGQTQKKRKEATFMEIVNFNNIDDFLKELLKEIGNIDRHIIRLTCKEVPSSMTNLCDLFIIANALVLPAKVSKSTAGKQLLKLSYHAGRIMVIGGKPADQADTETYNQFKNNYDDLKAKLQAQGYDVRSGVIEIKGGP